VNPVLILTRNCIELTKRTVESCLRQDIPTRIFIVDNGSSDGTRQWAMNHDYLLDWFDNNKGVSAGWNCGLNHLFNGRFGYSDCLVINNDVELAPWTYSLLRSYKLPFVTGVASNSLSEIKQDRPPQLHLEDHPDFSMFLISKMAWLKIGMFDEKMKFYAQDCDYHIRGFRLGVDMKKAVVPFFHVSSGTMQNASETERVEIATQANLDRAALKAKWGVEPGGSGYEKMFDQSLFGIDA